jgi:hypothetical protein
MSNNCPTCNRKIPKRVYTITGIFQHLGKVHSSSDLLRSKKYIYSVLDQLGATDEQKDSFHQRIENNITHTRDDVYDIVNEVLALARNDLVNKGQSLWLFIIGNYLGTGINESFADFYKKFKSVDSTISTQIVSRLLKAIGIKAKTKKTGNSSCMYFKISSGELSEKINTLGIMHQATPYPSDIEDDDNVIPCIG